MDKRDRQAILGQWGLRDETPREQRRAKQLAEDLEGSPLRGRPLPQRPRNFRPAVERYVASLGGPLPYMRRLRAIAEEVRDQEERLEAAWNDLAVECGEDAPAFARRWHDTAARWDFGVVNDLIERHNRWYPIEAQLPMDPRTRDFVHVAGEPYRKRPLDRAWVLERFPPELERAAA